jgi:asparagine synthase (glutamine-hydrolysing)
LDNEDGTVWVTYNGEIYNFNELRQELLRKGHSFRTECDTEVIVHAYEEYGPDCVSKFKGIFAFALWGRRKELLFLARDRLGIKPLYFAITDSWFVFASEIKAILQHPQVNAGADFHAIADYLQCTSLLDSKTMFRNIRSVPPATTLTIENGAVKERRYWALARDGVRHNGGSFEECRDEVRRLLESAVEMQMESNVPLGTLLSGGLDSSLVSAIAAKRFGGRLKTFSLGYHRSTLRADDADPHYARLVADAYGTDHTELQFQPDEYFDAMKTVTWHVEKRVELTSPSLYLLYRGEAVARCGSTNADQLIISPASPVRIVLQPLGGIFISTATRPLLMMYRYLLKSPSTMMSSPALNRKGSESDRSFSRTCGENLSRKPPCHACSVILVSSRSWFDLRGAIFEPNCRPPHSQ